MKWNRNRNVLLNGVVGALIGYAVARWRGRDDKRKIAVLVGTAFAVLNFLTYERVSDLDDLPDNMPEEVEEAVEEAREAEEESDDEENERGEDEEVEELDAEQE